MYCEHTLCTLFPDSTTLWLPLSLKGQKKRQKITVKLRELSQMWLLYMIGILTEELRFIKAKYLLSYCSEHPSSFWLWNLFTRPGLSSGHFFYPLYGKQSLSCFNQPVIRSSLSANYPYLIFVFSYPQTCLFLQEPSLWLWFKSSTSWVSGPAEINGFN